MAPINIVFSSDENFFKYTVVTLLSVLRNLTEDRRVCVYVLTDTPLSDELLKKASSLNAIREFELHNLIVDASQFENIRTTPGITLATYYRLVMHNVLPQDMARCIYLDSDIIVRKPLSEVYDIDMSGFLFAGVQDSISYVYNRRFGLPDRSAHINAGVTVVNLAFARSLPFSSMINEYLSGHRYLITLGDQQIINSVFHNLIKYLPVTWNVHGSMFLPDWREQNAGTNNSFSLAELDEAANDPALIHYTYKRKPWASGEHPRAGDWWDCALQTQFFTEQMRPAEAAPEKPKVEKRVPPPTQVPSPKKGQKKKASILSRVRGYLKSVADLRRTRLELRNAEQSLSALSAKVSTKLAAPPTASQLPSPPLVPYYLLDQQSAMLLASVGQRPLPKNFDARTFLEGIPEHQRWSTNGEPKDLDGGFHENLKTILKSPNVRRGLDLSETDGLILLVQRLRQDLYWKALHAANSYHKQLLFVETTFFGAFAPYFETSAPPLLRKSFGYVFDDMGYYFDARNPSRLETFLNSEESKLSERESDRARTLIEKIILNGITKYNYRPPSPPSSFVFPSNGVLLVDQKSNDASIEFGAASEKTFELMIQAAIQENPDAPIFLKLHPDNRGRNRHTFDGRVSLLPDECKLTGALDQCAKLYVVTSQVGFEGVLRGKEVHVFGLPFYSGWGLTHDRQRLPRRARALSVEELFHAACIRQSIYVDPRTGKLIDLEDALDFILEMRDGVRMPSITAA